MTAGVGPVHVGEETDSGACPYLVVNPDAMIAGRQMFPLTARDTYHYDRLMPQQSSGRSVAQFKPRAADLQAQIRRVALDSKDVAWSEHALERMESRGITTLDALRVLRTGDIIGAIEPGRSAGEWKCKMVARKKGSREIGVATVVLRSGRLWVKTVEWEDR